jgi:hypothetical protein
MPSEAPHPMLAPLLRQGGAAARWLAAGQASTAWGEGIGLAWQQTLALRTEPWPGLLALPLGGGNGALATALQRLVDGPDEGADEPTADADAVGRGRRRDAAARTPSPAEGRAAGVAAGRPAPPPADRGAARSPGPISALQAAAVLAQRAAAAGLAQAAHSLLAPAANTLDLSRWQLGAALAGALDQPAAGAARPPGLAQALAAPDTPGSSSMGQLSRAVAPLVGGTAFGGDGLAGAVQDLIQGGLQTAGGATARRPGPAAVGGREPAAAAAGRSAGGFGFDGSIAQALAGVPQAVRSGGFVASIAQAVADAQRQADPAPSRGVGGLRGLAARAAAAGAAAAGAATAAAAAGTGLGAALAGAAGGAAGAAEAGRVADAAGCGPCDMDDQRLAQQLARVLRREAERDGIDVDDVQP